MNERFLVTGALGCIGAWTLRALVRGGADVVGLDVSPGTERLRLVMEPTEIAGIELIAGDITDTEFVTRLVARAKITRIIHLAALQVPFCKADPALGARVNVVGTVNVFEAAKREGTVASIIYMSSIGMYDAADAVDPTMLREDAAAHPNSHYGVYKLANEGTARVYWQDDGVASLGLRPFVVFGPGRDQGLTSSPTLAMRAAAMGESYHIPFGGRAQYQYVADVAETIVAASLAPISGAAVVNFGGESLDMAEVVAAIEDVVPEAVGRMTFDDLALPFPGAVEAAALGSIIGDVPATPFRLAVRLTVDHFRATAQLPSR